MAELISNDSLLCSQIDVYPNFYQRWYIKELKQTDAKTHSQTLNGASKILWKIEWKYYWSQRYKLHYQNPTESNKLGTEGLRETELPTKKHAED